MRDLRLNPTGEKDDGPDALIATAKLKNGWQILWFNRYGCPFFGDAELGRLSMRGDILRCLVEEHVMACSAELWSAGSRQWFLSHEGEKGPKGLGVEGKPPACFPQIRQEMEAQQAAAGGDQAGVDYIFEIPLLTADALVAFKHDQRCEMMAEPAFDVLSRTEENRGGFFSRLLGKK